MGPPKANKPSDQERVPGLKVWETKGPARFLWIMITSSHLGNWGYGKMRSQDENCRSGKKMGTKLDFSPKLVPREVSPRVLDLPYLRLECCSYSSLNLTAWQKLNPANLLHWYHFHETVPRFSPHVTHTLNLGMKLGLDGQTRVQS
jgi:hypothetical protein